MDRLAVKTAIPSSIQAITNNLMDSTGLCTCGRILLKSDPKFVLLNLVPSQGMCVVAAYCQPCSILINKALKKCKRAVYDPNTPTEKINPLKSIKEA